MFLCSLVGNFNVGFNIIFDVFCDLHNLLSEATFDYMKFSIWVTLLLCESLAKQFLFGRNNHNFGFQGGKAILIFSSFFVIFFFKQAKSP